MTPEKHALNAFVILIIGSLISPTKSAELIVFAPGALRSTFSASIDIFEKDTGHKVNTVFGSTSQLYARITKGEASDVIILTPRHISRLRADRKISSKGGNNIAKVGIGAATRVDGKSASIDTIVSLKSLLETAGSVGYTDPKVGVAGAYLAKTFDNLGMQKTLGGKTRTFPPGRTLYDSIASGQVEIGFAPISEILARKNLKLIGPLPDKIQRYNNFAAGVSITSRNPMASEVFIQFLLSPFIIKMLRSNGLEPG